MNCRRCGRQLFHTQHYCPSCTTIVHMRFALIGGLILLVIGVLLAVNFTPEPQPQIDTTNLSNSTLEDSNDSIAPPPKNYTYNERMALPEGTNENTTITEKSNVEVDTSWRIIYEDNFEEGTTRWRNTLQRDMGGIAHSPTRSGNNSAMLSGGNQNFVFYAGYPLYNGVFVCHFYDNFTTIQDTLCAVSVMSIPRLQDSFMAGINLANDMNHYSVFYEVGTPYWETTEVERFQGWHKVVFEAWDRKNRIYIDDVLVAETDKMPVWTYVHALSYTNVKNPENSYFDDFIIAQKVVRRS